MLYQTLCDRRARMVFGGLQGGVVGRRTCLLLRSRVFARARHDLAGGMLTQAVKAGGANLVLNHSLDGQADGGPLLHGHRRQLHTTLPLHADDKATMSWKQDEPQPTKIGRMVYTVEVAVSKLFPAGFGWQYSSGIAEETFGLQANDYGFFIVTGLGDFCGVAAGHFSYYLAKKILYDRSIVVGEQAHVAFWLATAAFMSGGAWQPLVNFFQVCSGAGNHFNTHLMTTMACCGTMFYTGLRAGRYFLSPVLTGIPACDYNNLRADAQLSVAIGGATACFVGTDVSYGDGNWLRPLVGVEDEFGKLHGCVLAGTSTALGFTTVQIVENIVRIAPRQWVHLRCIGRLLALICDCMGVLVLLESQTYPMGTCWVD